MAGTPAWSKNYRRPLYGLAAKGSFVFYQLYHALLVMTMGLDARAYLESKKSNRLKT